MIYALIGFGCFVWIIYEATIAPYYDDVTGKFKKRKIWQP